eukprot:jgi/Chrpa1/26252/Chrysochromulina_OHIO_Genome00006255-RA
MSSAESPAEAAARVSGPAASASAPICVASALSPACALACARTCATSSAVASPSAPESMPERTHASAARGRIWAYERVPSLAVETPRAAPLKRTYSIEASERRACSSSSCGVQDAMLSARKARAQSLFSSSTTCTVSAVVNAVVRACQAEASRADRELMKGTSRASRWNIDVPRIASSERTEHSTEVATAPTGSAQ